MSWVILVTVLLVVCLEYAPVNGQSFFQNGFQNGYNPNAPAFQLNSYTFNLTRCDVGQFVATVTASNPRGGPIAYSIDGGTGTPSNMVVNYQTGQLNFATAPSAKFKFLLRATNYFGAAVVPITIRCTDDHQGYDIVCFNNFCTNTSMGTGGDTVQSFTVGNCYSGASVGSLDFPTGYTYSSGSGGSFFVDPLTGAITLTGNAGVGAYQFTVVAYAPNGQPTPIQVTVTLACDGSLDTSGNYVTGLKYVCFGGNCYVPTAGQFSSSGIQSSGTAGGTSVNSLISGSATSYSFTSAGCTAGSGVGQLALYGAYNYGISSGSSGFQITSSGYISLVSDLTAGSYSLVVTAYGGTSTTISVNITVSCSGTGSGTSTGTISTSSGTNLYVNTTCLYGNCLFNSTAPVFLSSPYTFAITSCVSGITVGTVNATGATGYYIVETGPWSNYFTIGRSSGIITEVATVPAGNPVYLTVTATNINGVPSNVLVVVTTVGCITTTTAASTTTTTAGTNLPVFTQTAYTFTQAVGAIGTLGTVTSTNAATYTITSGNNGGFAVDSTGKVTEVVAQPAGTYNLQVTACNTVGNCATVPVTVIVQASATGAPVFGQPAGYAFTTTDCIAGTDVGTVTATNTVAYGLENNLPAGFTVDMNGDITLTTAQTAGTYNLQVRAFSANGASTLVPVTVTVVCAG